MQFQEDRTLHLVVVYGIGAIEYGVYERIVLVIEELANRVREPRVVADVRYRYQRFRAESLLSGWLFTSRSRFAI